MKLKTIIIDDEQNAVEVLQLMLKPYHDRIEISACCHSADDGIFAISKHEPDLVFLDIAMPQKSGFDVVKETAGLQYKIIFTTAYDQFAIQAIKHSALDYLLKPIDRIELQQALQKVFNEQGKTDINTKINFLLTQLTVHKTEKVALPVGEVFELFEPKEIVRFESESNYTHVFLKNGKKLVLTKTLKEVESIMQGLAFFRTHQSHFINTQYIIKFIRGDNAYLVMQDGSSIPLSRQRKEAFAELFRKL